MAYVTFVFTQLIPVNASTYGNPPMLHAGAGALELLGDLAPPPGAGGAMQPGVPPYPAPPAGGLPAEPAWLFAPGNIAAGDSSPYWARAWIPDTLAATYLVQVRFGCSLSLGEQRRQAAVFTIRVRVQPNAGGGPLGVTVNAAMCSSPAARVSANPDWVPGYDEWTIAVSFAGIAIPPPME